MNAGDALAVAVAPDRNAATVQPMGRCSTSTLYVAGYQINIRDILTARFDGKPVDPAALAFIRQAGTVELTTRFGTCSNNIDPTRLHGRAARRAATEPPSDVLAALTLANLAGHPQRGESAAWSTRTARTALRHVPEPHLLELLDTHGPHMFGMLIKLASGQVALRSWRSATVAARFATIPDAPDLVTAAVRDVQRVAVTVNRAHPTVMFEQALRNGERPAAKGWAQKAALAASNRDAALELANDQHPLVRAAAYRHLGVNELTKRLTSDPDPTARRAAAAAVCATFKVPLVHEGRLGVTTPAGRPARVVFVDVDGTLIDGPVHRDNESIAVLRSLQQTGMHVVAVTGRDVDTYCALELGFELAVCDGHAIDVVSMTELGDVADKGQAVAAICSMLGEQSCAAVGDGSIDTAMFAAVRERGGRCGWVATGQAAPAVHATDLVGPVGSGGVGRFVADVAAGAVRPVVAPISVVERTLTNYAAQVLPRSTFETLAEQFALRPGDDWALAHGHITTAYPDRTQNAADLPAPSPGASVEAYGVVRTDQVTAFAVRVDGETHQPNGKPLHCTVGLAPTATGHEKPAIAGDAVKVALENGTLEQFNTPVRIETVAAPAGVETTTVPADVVAAAAAAHHDLGVYQRAIRAGVEPGLVAEHATASSPLGASLAAGGKLQAGLIVLVGPPASGKSTFATKLAREHDAVVVNLDSIRGELNGDESSQERGREVAAVGEARLAFELTLGRLVVSDATNVKAGVIRSHVARAHTVGLPAVAVPLTVERDVALERDRLRHEDGKRAVGTRNGRWTREAADEVLGRMYHHWETSVGALQNETFGLDAIVTADMLLGPSS